MSQASSLSYVDSSVLLEQLLRERDVRSELRIEGEWITSEITELECRRTLDRVRIHEQVDDEELADRYSELDYLFRFVQVIHLEAPVLNRAKGSFPTVVRSLDAIHLATAELAKAEIFVTRDKQLAIAARAIGLRASGPHS